MTDRTVLWLYEDPGRGLTLVRGTYGTKSVLDAADLLEVARYSVSGKGWVIPGDRAADLCAAAETVGALYRIKQVSADG